MKEFIKKWLIIFNICPFCFHKMVPDNYGKHFCNHCHKTIDK